MYGNGCDMWNVIQQMIYPGGKKGNAKWTEVRTISFVAYNVTWIDCRVIRDVLADAECSLIAKAFVTAWTLAVITV